MAQGNVEVTIVYPAYNESEGLEKAVTESLSQLPRVAESFEIVIAEDGSSDGTDLIAERLAQGHDSVLHLHSDKRLGRGRALNRAFKQARGRILVYMDVDLATDIGYLGPLVDSIRGGFDIATGSRTLPGSTVRRSPGRKLTSWAYNTLIRLLFGTPVGDHQCGFKAFNAARLLEIIDEVEDSHWFWDTEVLVLAAHHGYRIAEIPIEWTEGRGTKVRVLRDSYRMASKALHLWWRLRSAPALGPGH